MNKFRRKLENVDKVDSAKRKGLVPPFPPNPRRIEFEREIVAGAVRVLIKELFRLVVAVVTGLVLLVTPFSGNFFYF